MYERKTYIITIVQANTNDLDWLSKVDASASQEAILHQIEAGEVLVANICGEPAGLLRFDYLWTTMPYISQLRVLKPFRKRGVAKALLGILEGNMRQQEYGFLISSTMPDNPISQKWHRRMGFIEIGFLAGINTGGVGEIFYRKEL